MLTWWNERGIDQVDVAVRRVDGVMCWQRAVATEAVPLPWLGAENAGRADVYIRPSQGRAWPMLFLDDVALREAARVSGHYDALVVQSSVAGGCHIWLCCAPELAVAERGAVQRVLAARTGADPRSTSGDHLGRLAGFRNWKRSGQWVNVLPISVDRPPWNARGLLDRGVGLDGPLGAESAGRIALRTPMDSSESGKEWGWVCGALAAGMPPAEVTARLARRALSRRRRGAEAYAQRTVDKAVRRRH